MNISCTFEWYTQGQKGCWIFGGPVVKNIFPCNENPLRNDFKGRWEKMEINRHKEDEHVNKCLHNNLRGSGKCKQELHT